MLNDQQDSNGPEGFHCGTPGESLTEEWMTSPTGCHGQVNSQEVQHRKWGAATYAWQVKLYPT